MTCPSHRLHFPFIQHGMIYLNMIACLFVATQSSAEGSFTMAWVKQFGSPENELASAITVDSEGNSYVVGSTEGKLGKKSFGETDVFLTKADPEGNTLWSKQIGSRSDDEGWGVATDLQGNAYLALKTFKGDFGGGRIGGLDGHIIKYSPDGEQLWATPLGAHKHDSMRGICIDKQGNVYATGYSQRTRGKPFEDAFVYKLDASGKKVWTARADSESNDRPQAIAVDAEGNTYIAGWTTGAIGDKHHGNWDGFIVKFGPDGTKEWAKQLGTRGRDECLGLAIDKDQAIYVIGETSGKIAQRRLGKPARYMVNDVFIFKFDPDGQEYWSKQLSDEMHYDCRAIAITPSNGVIIGGGRTRITPQGSFDGEKEACLIRFNSEGRQLKIETYGTALTSFRALAFGPGDELHVCGRTKFDLDGPNQGKFDFYSAKLTER